MQVWQRCGILIGKGSRLLLEASMNDREKRLFEALSKIAEAANAALKGGVYVRR
jgi:hypothetical protein